MKKIFQFWLLLFVCAACGVTLFVSYHIQSDLAKRSAMELLGNQLVSIAQNFDQRQQNLDAVRALNNQAALAKCRMLAKLIRLNPEFLQKQELLDELAKELDVDQLHVSDGNGILIATVPASYRGYDMNSNEQSRPFMESAKNPDFELVQEPRANGFAKVIIQYAGVARQDAPGIVQIGYKPERLVKAMEIANFEKCAEVFKIGSKGGLFLRKNEQKNMPAEKVFYREIGGEKCLCMAHPWRNYLLVGYLPESEMYLPRDVVLLILIVGNLILFGIIFFLISSLLQRVVIRGILSINASLTRITGGDLNEEIHENGTKEFEVLSRGINSTVLSLKNAIEKEARRLDSELEVGRMIQSSVLPGNFPDNERVRLFASMKPAKEVGGDFYDFFMVGDRYLAALIADVSGKGLTAALFMMNSKALLKELILAGKNPGEVFARANEELCRGNQANMFLTAFLMGLDLETGEIVWVSAGHNPPLKCDTRKKWSYMEMESDPVLGMLPGISFTERKGKLEPGERLFLYTDGVTEAMNPVHEQFGETRLETLLNRIDGNPSSLQAQVRTELRRFADGASQSDDITILVLDYRPAVE